MNQDKEIFVSLFGTIPAKPEFFLRWLNGQLRYLFGFTIKKTSRKKNFSLSVKFCATWRFGEEIQSDGEIFIPLVEMNQ
ncbi:putative replication origin-binding protein [Tokyovirus A1]|uniref:putative replication origin-binding protein n=1 Tax=Tokyovirus A1 TaxID=1826170 RepID=UPI0007A99020|nr:putative replication origin-binding protein [Tokyovirus A1]BAU80347.1 putative replication origin-binding protein [Tokyovirus A1]